VSPFPHVAEIGDVWGKLGSGIGDESSAALSALGEYFERRHFYMEISPQIRSTLDECLSPRESALFQKAFAQTAKTKADVTHVDTHLFGMTKVARISDFSDCFIPTVTLNLTHTKGDADDAIFPERDTCGCSFHTSAENAMFGSLKESLERQFLTRFWLTGKCVEKHDESKIKRYLLGRPTLGLLELLSKAGRVCAINISDHRFPGCCVLVVYGSDITSRHVQYCAGMAYAESIEEAIEKSILELWQTYRFIDLFRTLNKNVDDINDSYLKHFLNCNNIKIFNEVIDTHPSESEQESRSICSPMNLSSLVKSLQKLSIEGYFYLYSSDHITVRTTFSKFVSPSLFMHMNNAKKCNIDNEYSRDFLNQVIPSRLCKMVPFP
jgi:hypothetical protein